MSFLLKIVQGPNAGAEIALAEGMTLSVGSADTCDIVFSDAAVEAQAFELEVTQERVMVILPGGKTIKLDPYHVTLVGTTALAVGPAEGTWKELVWPKQEKPAEAVAESAAEALEDTPPESEAAKPEKRRSRGCLGFFLVLSVLVLVALGAGAWAYWKYPEESKPYAQQALVWLKQAGEIVREKAGIVWAWTCEKGTACYQQVTQEPPPPPPAETLEEAALACGFALSGTPEGVVATGDFATRAERLQATARAYAARPGVRVDFADAESLKTAVDELLTLVSEDRLEAVKVEGRKLFLAGTVPTQAALRKVLESLRADVPKITETDCSAVTITGVTRADVEPEPEQRYHVPRLPANRTASASAAGEGVMPIVGILTVPYPCLVLEDGTRAMEGARFGTYVIEKIEADAVTVRGNDGAFVWRP